MTCPKNSLCPPPQEVYATTNNYLTLTYGNTGETYSISDFNISPLSQPDGHTYNAVVVFINTISNHYVFQPSFYEMTPEDSLSEFFNQASLSEKFPAQLAIVEQFFSLYNPSTLSSYTQYEPTTDEWELFLLGNDYLEFDTTSLKYYECPGVCPPPQEYIFGGQNSLYKEVSLTMNSISVGFGITNFSVQNDMLFCLVNDTQILPFTFQGTVTSGDFVWTAESSTPEYSYTELTKELFSQTLHDQELDYSIYNQHDFASLEESSFPLQSGSYSLYMYNVQGLFQLRAGGPTPEFDAFYLIEEAPPSEENSNSLSLLSIILIILGLYYISTMISSRRS